MTTGSAHNGGWGGTIQSAEIMVRTVNHCLDAVIISHPNGGIVFANPAACVMFRASQQELRRLDHYALMDKEDQATRDVLAELTSRRQVRALVPLARTDSSWFLAAIAAATFPVESGGELICTVLRDATIEVREQRRLAAYDAVAEALLGKADLSHALGVVARHARIIFEATDAAVVLRAVGGEDVVVEAVDGPNMATMTGRRYKWLGPQQELASGRPTIIEDLAASAVTKEGRGLRLGPAMVVQISSDRRTFGILMVGRPRGTRPYTHDDLARAVDFGKRAGVVMAIGEDRADAETHQQRTVEQLSREKQALLQAVSVDHRTGLANTAAFDADHAQLYARFERSGEPYSVVLVDVDHFHDFNHRYHYLAGNAVLKRLAATLARTVRKGDRAYRWGGEEFAVLLPGTRLEAAAVVAERIRAAAEGMKVEHAGSPSKVVTVTAGVAQATRFHNSVDEVFEAVSALLVEGKDGGRNRVVVPPTDRPGSGLQQES